MQATQANAALFTKIQQDHTLALENLATVTQSNRTLVAMSTKTISELLGQFATLTAKLATAQSKNARLKKLGTSFGPGRARPSGVHKSVPIIS